MKYLEDNHVQHRDLKASNCLVEYEDGLFRVKIADFGLSKSKILVSKFTRRSSLNGGTATHMAPEVLRNDTFTEKGDVYSYAIVMYEVLTRLVPYEGLNQPQIIAQVDAGRRPSPIPEDSPPELVALMKKCWEQEPFVRPDFARIANQLKPLLPLKAGVQNLPPATRLHTLVSISVSFAPEPLSRALALSLSLSS